MLVAGLSTGHKVGLLVVALVFIVFSLVSSFVAPRYMPDFPGKRLNAFVAACIALFVLMLGSVVIFGVEGEGHAASAAEPGKAAGHETVVEAVESEWRIQLPAKTAHELVAGAYTFHVVNKGKQPHNLTIDGPGVANAHTKLLAPGASADLAVKLETGTYDVYCSVPGHKQLGMDAKLAIA